MTFGEGWAGEEDHDVVESERTGMRKESHTRAREESETLSIMNESFFLFCFDEMMGYTRRARRSVWEWRRRKGND